MRFSFLVVSVICVVLPVAASAQTSNPSAASTRRGTASETADKSVTRPPGQKSDEPSPLQKLDEHPPGYLDFIGPLLTDAVPGQKPTVEAANKPLVVVAEPTRDSKAPLDCSSRPTESE